MSAPVPHVTRVEAAVYHNGRRRFLTRRAAYLALARSLLRAMNKADDRQPPPGLVLDEIETPAVKALAREIGGRVELQDEDGHDTQIVIRLANALAEDDYCTARGTP